jgi:large subunit ribosomal protein L31
MPLPFLSAEGPEDIMREGIHPEYPAAKIQCACGNTFVTRSTRGDFQVDVCGACHPFYTGTQKLVDTAGRVDRFRKRYQPKAGAPASAAPASTSKPS